MADQYDKALVVKVYSAAVLPWLPDMVQAIAKNADHDFEHLVIRLSRELQSMKASLRGEWEDGMIFHLKDPLTKWNGIQRFLENGIVFEADLVHGQKTGFFLDQRGNRALVRELSAGKDVLNMFSYSGGFSVYAAAGGAKSVTSVDFNRHAIEDCGRIFAMNKGNPSVASCRHTGIADDAFHALDSFAGERKSFDLIIVDPPSFAKSREEISGALHSYARLARGALKLLRKNGILVFASCSSRVDSETLFHTVLHQGDLAGKPLKEFRRTFHEADHPARFRESSYLKCIYARV